MGREARGLGEFRVAEEVRRARMLDVQALVILQKSPQERDQNHTGSAAIVRPSLL